MHYKRRSDKTMSMSTLKDVVEAIKVRSKTIAETTTGTIAGSTANDMVYAAKAIEAIIELP